MPELPDVEIVRRRLSRWIGGGVIVAARSRDAYVTRKSPVAFGRALDGARVVRVERRGKWLRWALDERVVFAHLGMTGDWVRAAPDAKPLAAERARVDVRRGESLVSVRYTDPRRFGRLLVARGDIAEWTELGPDPYADGLDARTLEERLDARRASIKEALMDQHVLAGVGNIVATEALFRARIDPRKPAGTLTSSERRALARALHVTIEAGLARRDFLVYGRGGEPCPRCGRPLAKIVLGGRGTTFCVRCQPRGA